MCLSEALMKLHQFMSHDLSIRNLIKAHKICYLLNCAAVKFVICVAYKLAYRDVQLHDVAHSHTQNTAAEMIANP